MSAQRLKNRKYRSFGITLASVEELARERNLFEGPSVKISVPSLRLIGDPERGVGFGGEAVWRFVEAFFSKFK